MSRLSRKSERERILADLQNCEDSDEESDIPPPPPPLPNELHTKQHLISPVVVSTTVSFEDDILMSDIMSAENSRNTQDDLRRPYDMTETSSGTGKHVPLRGHFQGQSKAQEFDEEEAATDEIEVPTSRVVRRMTRQEHINESLAIEKAVNSSFLSSVTLWKNKKRRFWFCVVACFLVVLVVALAVAFSTVQHGDDDTSVPTYFPVAIPAPNMVTPTASEPTIAPTTDSHTKVTTYLTSLGIQGLEESLINENSPQYMALHHQNIATKYFANPDLLDIPEMQLDLKQRFAAGTVFMAANGKDWKTRTGWMSDKDVCEWSGVECVKARRMLSVGFRAVTVLDLTNNNLQGVVPPELVLFEDITNLRLSDNKLKGPVLLELYQLTKLQELDLSANSFTGKIPFPSILSLLNLQILSLGKNNFTGTIPDIFDKNLMLKQLLLSNNKLGKTIPKGIGKLQQLQILDLTDNEMTGTIPIELSIMGWANNTDVMKELYLGDNEFKGNIPTEFGFLTELTKIDMRNNKLTNVIPSDLGKLTNLEELVLSHNYNDKQSSIGGFSGEIPKDFGNLEKLRILLLEKNSMVGTLPPELGNLISLERFEFYDNSFTGTLPLSVCKLSSLDVLVAGCDFGCSTMDCCTDKCDK